MIFNYNGPEDSYPKTICELDEHTINNVKMFKYLGANIQYKDAATGDAEINQRLDSAEAKFYEHSKKLMNFQISSRNKNAYTERPCSKQTNVWLSGLDSNHGAEKTDE